MTNQNHAIHSVFPTPVYITKRDTNLSPKEEKEIRKVVKEGVHRNVANTISDDFYIFNRKLKNIKQFCEKHIKSYVEQIIYPKEEALDFYITQSWLNITRPGEHHHEHCHQNSIISGIFYISTEEDDKITFTDPNIKMKNILTIIPEKYNLWNSHKWFFPSVTNELILFPSLLNHQVIPNVKATTDRISLSFNTFAKGTFGEQGEPAELILK